MSIERLRLVFDTSALAGPNLDTANLHLDSVTSTLDERKAVPRTVIYAVPGVTRVLIGRGQAQLAAIDPNAQYVLLGSRLVSRAHLGFSFRDGRWIMQDLGALNRTTYKKRWVTAQGEILTAGQEFAIDIADERCFVRVG
jgi:hypothetical protein